MLVEAQLQGASLVEAQLQGASLEWAQLQGALLYGAQLQGASLEWAQLQGALLYRAQLQGASLYGAQLQGASLAGAQLQGASIGFARLESASLAGALLQGGALLYGAGPQGASLEWARLEGGTLAEAQLQGVSLTNVFVWRVGPPRSELVKGALIRSPSPGAEYFDPSCKAGGGCDWTREYYNGLKAKIEAAPPGRLRDDALERIKPLGVEPFTVDEEAATKWWALAVASEDTAGSYPERLAETLIKTGCDERGAPYVIRGLVRQLGSRFFDSQFFDSRFFSRDAPQKAAVARAFLEPGCDGARGLSDDDKARLRRLAGPPTK